MELGIVFVCIAMMRFKDKFVLRISVESLIFVPEIQRDHHGSIERKKTENIETENKKKI